MFNLKTIKYYNKSKNKVLFFHGFGTKCEQYNLSEWDDKLDKPYKDGTIRTNNWLNNLGDTFGASELIYYNRNEENCFYPNNKKLSTIPNIRNHLIKLHNKLETKKIINSYTNLYLVGHSMGCIFALNYALMFPENIKGIVFIDSLQLIPKFVKIYSNKKFMLSDNKINILKNKRDFTKSDKNKWYNYIMWDIFTNSHIIVKTNIKLLCFWNVTSNSYGKEFSILLKKFSKNIKNIELINRDHFLNETDDIKINNIIKKFI